MLFRFPNIILILTFGFLLFLQTNSFAQEIVFNHLTVENGLSNNKVNTVMQDRTGFIWFGTEDGLNRYDGYNFKIFRHDPSDSNSLSGNSIWSLMEDHKGNIWIGTKGGVLNKFIPITEQFTRWEINSDLTEENGVKSIYEDSKRNIWIGSYKDGLYRLNPSTNRIDHWSSDPDDVKSLSHNYVNAIIEDNEGNILIGTYIGLCKFNPDLLQNGFERFYYNPKNRNSLSNNLIWGLSKSLIDPGSIWVGTSNKLTKFNSANKTFKRIEIPNPDNLQYGTGVGGVLEEVVEGKKIIWADSYAGLLRINLDTGETTRFINDENNSQSLISNQINKIIKDRSGVIWIATENGISQITPKSTLFNSIAAGSTIANVLSKLKKKNITAISISGEKRILIGTMDGLYSLEDITAKPQLRRLNEFNDFHIWSMASVSEGELWVGTYGKGLKEYNYQSKRITNQNLSHPKIQTQSLYYNKSLLTDSKNNIWVGYWGVGVARINLETRNYDVWLSDPENYMSLSHNDVWVIKEDRLGRIWLGTTGGGLNLFEDINGGMFHYWFKKNGGPNSLSSNNIYSICESRNGKYSADKNRTVLWIGTNNGLNQFIIKNKNNNQNLYEFDVEINSYTVNDGLPDNSVNSILEDDDGNIWLGTGSGISFFDATQKHFTNFSSADGLNGTEMNYESALKLANGVMLFGSTKGLNIFDPKKIKLSSYKPSVVMTDFQIFNKSVKIGGNSLLKESITNTKEIVLPYNQDVFSFEFAALDYNSPWSIQYAYQLKGFDTDWVPSGKRRFVTYTNLDPGNYTFNVKATNADGIWSDEYASIKIIVNPPWWKSSWAYVLYLMTIAISLYGIRRFSLNRTKLRDELKMRGFESQKLREIENMKSRFFANLSHEFRTPLMLIKGPLEQLKDGQVKGDPQNYYDLIYRNAENLQTLIDQLLQLTQLEVEAIPIMARNENLITILKGIFYSFESIATQKNISVEFIAEDRSICAWVDKDKLEKIINNILSNAFKFTPSGGMISLHVGNIRRDSEDFAVVQISDTGIGISEDKLDRIFDRFYQVDDSSGRAFGGSGIGLSLVKELVELHKWKINIESEMAKGTSFILTIPLSDSYLPEKQKIKEENNSNNISSDRDEITNHQNGVTVLNDSVGHKNKYDDDQIFSNESKNNNPSILVVEDSSDVREYIFSLFQNDYNIFQAENGEDGLRIAAEHMPDLIISDIMMPGMDGIEFCKCIKTDFQTSHIPVILLTAKVSQENKIEGLEIGADDYVTKPFNFKELSVRIKNLLDQRKRLKDKFSKEINIKVDDVTVNSIDKEFLEKALNVAEINLQNPEFDSGSFAKKMYVSRSQFYRKMIAITGQGPGEFIRTYRLKKSAQLLIEKKLSVTQIALEVGFNSPSHFTKAFQLYFNCRPSEFIAQNHF